MSVLERGTDDVQRVQVLDPDGRVLPDADPPDLPAEELRGMYEAMWLARHFDERAVSLQRQGRIATYAPMRGQEAAQVASTWALAPDDWLFPTYRDHAAKAVHGVPLETVLRRMCGHQPRMPEANVLPESIPIATQIPHAVGAAVAASRRGEDAVALCVFGDGATSEGDFHEGLNFAGVFDAPAVFLCNNNQWAISTPYERQTASATIAQKAVAYGFEGVRVDGTDPLAVYEVTREAVERARDPADGEARPTLVEAVQYRVGAHSTADDPSVYRGEVPEEWQRRDPVPRFESYLRERGVLDDERAAAIRERVEDEVAEAIRAAEATEADPDAMFDHAYAELPPRLREQREEVRRQERDGDSR